LFATVTPITVTIGAEGVAVDVVEVNDTTVRRSSVGRKDTASVLDGVVVRSAREDGDLGLDLLNEDAGRNLDTRTGGSGNAGKALAVDALVSTAAEVGCDSDSAGTGLAVTNPDVLVLRSGGFISVSLATVTRIQIGIVVAGSAVHDARTGIGGIPDAVATEAKVVELIGSGLTDQVATSVQAVIASTLTFAVEDGALREDRLNDEAGVATAEEGRLDNSRAI